MEFNKPVQLNESVFKKYALKKATDEKSVIYTSLKYKRSLFIVRANSIIRIKKGDLKALFDNLRTGDKFVLQPEDVAAFSKKSTPSQEPDLFFVIGNVEIHFHLSDGVYKAKVMSTKQKSKVKIAVYVIGGSLLACAVIGGAIFLIGPGAIAAIAIAKGAMVYGLAKAHPFICMGVVSSIGMLALKYYQHKNNPKENQQPADEPAAAPAEAIAKAGAVPTASK